MTVSEQIKVLCVRNKISAAELARRLNKTPQNLSLKMKRGTFSIAELEKIAELVDCKYYHYFKLPNGDIIK